jgi:hypothetical protein
MLIPAWLVGQVLFVTLDCRESVSRNGIPFDADNINSNS